MKIVKRPAYDGSQNCFGLDIDFFYQEEGDTDRKIGTKGIHDTLRRICSTCPFLDECREYAIYHEGYGFWGGMSENQRRNYRREHKIVVMLPEVISLYGTDYYERYQHDR